MKLSDLRKIVREELDKVVKERTIARREPPRKMTKPQIGDRDKIGKKIKSSPKATKYFKDKFGDDWESYLWASAGNKAMGDHVEPKDGPMLQEVVRLRDISSVVTFPRLNALKEALPSSFPGSDDNQSSVNISDDMESGEEEHAKAKLMRIHKQSAALYNMLGDVDDGAEEWVIKKIGDAAECLNSAYNHIEYEKTKPTALGNGEGTPADGIGSAEQN